MGGAMATFQRYLPGLAGILCLLVALATVRIVFLPLEAAMPNMAHYAQSLPLALWGHILFSPLALFLMPFQLSARLRGRRPRLHRWTGRLYALAVLGGGVSAIALVTRIEASAFAALGFGLLGATWIAVTAAGIRAAMAGRMAEHRRWMLRSAALSFAAVTLRLMMPILVAGAGMTNAESYQIISWACWLPNLLAVELWLRHERGMKDMRATQA